MNEGNDKHGLAINIIKFQYFNLDFFNCQEIVLYETLVVLGGISFAKKEEFYHSTQTLAGKTGIKEAFQGIQWMALSFFDRKTEASLKVKMQKLKMS